MTHQVLERDLVQECREIAKAMNAYLLEVGQRRAKGSGTTVGFPDLVLVCSGKVQFIEVKRPKTADHPQGYVSLGQQAVIERCADQGVTVHVLHCAEQFIEIVNSCRRGRCP